MHMAYYCFQIQHEDDIEVAQSGYKHRWNAQNQFYLGQTTTHCNHQFSNLSKYINWDNLFFLRY